MSTPITPFSEPAATSPTFSFGGYAAEEVGLAGIAFWPRAGARVIDYVLHYCVTYSAGFLFSLLVLAAAGGHMPPWIMARFRHPGLFRFIPGLLGFVVYNVICVSMHGSTLGKRLISAVVVQESGIRCRTVPAAIRELAYYIDSLFFGLVGYLAMQGSYQEQRYGDRWARTVVAKRAKVIPEQLRSDGRFVVTLMLAAMTDAALGMIGLLILISG